MNGPILCLDAERVAEFVARFAEKPFVPPYTAFGIQRGGVVTGGFVFTTYTGPSVEMSLAGPDVSKRWVWPAVIEYVFGQLGCRRLGITVRADNKPVCRLARKLGFVYEGPGRLEYGAVNSARFSLTAGDLAEFRRKWRLEA